jgi:hypothetical protein
MRVLAVICAATLTGFAQSPPPKVPKKTDSALRNRVTEFHRNQMAGNFRKALDLVAKDSQDFFLSMSKTKASVFKIEDIQYKDKFSKAIVKIATTNHVMVGVRTIEVPTSAVDYWKLEDGKWMWYHDVAADQPNFFGVPIGEGSKDDATLAKAVPKDTSPQALTSAAESALQGASNKSMFDKESLEFTLGKPGTQEFKVRNGYSGSVHLVVALPAEQTGVTVEPSEIDIKPRSEVTVKVRYWALYKQPATTNLTLKLEPFPRLYSFPVVVVPEPQDAKP